ncbi:glycosyl transferase family 2 [Pseudoflavitalea sp. G-6-1-2]|uniref:cytidylyltransferase domain-containing protein n=1 Tax=Pseudoflavitalea sp. G-6-1-2 TaxID=2728841 RepID=UPI001469B93C|nr:glycosyl transferase family 2 [Pseudoflavitalea sp. G-6-1-2]NML19616.1 glycosyl transferase family 2 [Pseudoflavitalea sp. G-6-1-2]
MQARTGSTRLPKKMLLPFFGGKTIVQLLIERLQENFGNIPLYLLTTTNPGDDVLIDSVKDYPNLHTFRGDEQNVLKRFTDAGKEFGVENIIRVCADNPFILPEFIRDLLKETDNGNDYTSFSFEQTPVIKCHFGFFTEMVKLTALEKVRTMTSEQLYQEHVTNYLYTNPGSFRIHLIDKSRELDPFRNFRLTIDTGKDFEIAGFIYKELAENNELSVNGLLKIAQQYPHLLQEMKTQQLINQK